MSHTLVAKGLKKMSRGPKVSRSFIANMVLFVNVGNFLNEKLFIISTIHWDIGDDSFAYLYARRGYF